MCHRAPVDHLAVNRLAGAHRSAVAVDIGVFVALRLLMLLVFTYSGVAVAGTAVGIIVVVAIVVLRLLYSSFCRMHLTVCVRASINIVTIMHNIVQNYYALMYRLSTTWPM